MFQEKAHQTAQH